MSINRGYVSNHKFWDRMGRITPSWEHSESHRPHFESMPAPWLNVQREEKEYEYWIVVSSGKVVAEDRNGHLVPAGLRKAWNVASGTTILTYVQNDVDQYVTDLTTGAVLTAAVSYTEDEVTAALKERGFIRATERAMDFIGKPVGFASYNYYQACGDDTTNPAGLRFHNWRVQAQPAITCDYVGKFPVIPAVATTETMNGVLANGAGSIDWATARTGGWFGSTALHGLVKYSSSVAAGDNIVGYVTEKWPIAADTAETTIAASVAGLTKEVSAVGEISAAGDYYLDYDLGILFLYSAGGNAIPSPWSLAATLTYYHYEDSVDYDDARITTYACATGDLEYGDFLTYDGASNLIKANLDISAAEGYDASYNVYSGDPDYDVAGTDAAISLQIENAVSNYLEGIVGQVIGVEEFPKDNLDRVRTEYIGQTAANMRTPGSATGGRSDQLTYAGGAERMIVVNLIFR